jgi:programmed cell death 6-interacting protein
VRRNKAEAETDNNSIYMEVIPKPADLAPVAAASLVKPLAMPALAPFVAEVGDLFEGLVPMEVNLAASVFTDQVSSIVRETGDAVKALDDDVRAKLASVGLPASIEAQERCVGLPETVWAKLQGAQAKGGVQGLRQQLDHNRGVADSCEELLGSAERQLNQEQTEDDRCRAQFKEGWVRPSSASLNTETRAQLAKYGLRGRAAHGSHCTRAVGESRWREPLKRAVRREHCTRAGTLVTSVLL